jgi:hypothetical protein
VGIPVLFLALLARNRRAVAIRGSLQVRGTPLVISRGDRWSRSDDLRCVHEPIAHEVFCVFLAADRAGLPVGGLHARLLVL